MPAWTILGAPLDSSGTGRGEEAAPQALRAAGLAQRLDAVDAGDVAGPLRPAVRDPETGVIALDSLRRATGGLSAAVAETLERGARPLVIGGDCSLLPGALSGARLVAGRLGLWFVDGHADFFDGQSSPTGEAADMELAFVTGAGLPGLGGPRALVEPQDAVILGHRPPGLSEDVAEELARVPEALARVPAHAIRSAGPVDIGREWAARLGDRGPVWLHLDLDVLDERAMPAVSYPQPEGLDWEELEALVRPLLCHPALVGLSVADLNPDRDPDGAYARQTVEVVARAAG